MTLVHLHLCLTTTSSKDNSDKLSVFIKLYTLSIQNTHMDSNKTTTLFTFDAVLTFDIYPQCTAHARSWDGLLQSCSRNRYHKTRKLNRYKLPKRGQPQTNVDKFNSTDQVKRNKDQNSWLAPVFSSSEIKNKQARFHLNMEICLTYIIFNI